MKKREIILFVGGSIGLVVFCVVVARILIIYNNFKPEQSAQVEVVGKRIKEVRAGGLRSGGPRTNYHYIVSFKFPDGSVKELEVGMINIKNKQEISCVTYDAIHEGDTGILTYQEIKNLEKHIKNEDMYWSGRRFISFKKDSMPSP